MKATPEMIEVVSQKDLLLVLLATLFTLAGRTWLRALPLAWLEVHVLSSFIRRFPNGVMLRATTPACGI